MAAESTVRFADTEVYKVDQKPQDPEGAKAIRSYLTAAITPVLLKALVQMEAEDPPRPILWLADYLERQEDSA